MLCHQDFFLPAHANWLHQYMLMLYYKTVNESHRICSFWTIDSPLFIKIRHGYQYNTGSHRRPRSHGSFDPIFLDGRGSTNFGIQSDLSTSSKALRAVDQSCPIFVLIAHHLKKNDDSPFTSVRFFCFWGCSSFDPMFFGAPAVEVVLELRKYYFWRNFWRMTFDEWLTYDSLFIFRIYHGEEQTETKIHQGTSALSKQYSN